jgi:GNAT superfamily N-acetyltransferase
MREMQPSQLSRLTQIDYDREMAFIAARKRPDGSFETLGVVRAIADPNNTTAEFAIIVRSDMKGKGLGRLLMKKLVDYCRAHGIKEIVGETLNYNRGLLTLVRKFGFTTGYSPDGDTTLLKLDLRAARTLT